MADPYLMPGTTVLRNKLGHTDMDALDRAEYMLAETESLRLFQAGRPADVSMRAWKTIHKTLFGDVYDWAGDYRTVYLTKPHEAGASSFCAPDRIGIEGDRVLKGLKAALRHSSKDPLEKTLSHLADSYIELNFVHPFREGNGRSQKVFFSMFSRPYGIQLDWSAIPPGEHNKAALLGAKGEPGMMRDHFIAIGSQRANSDVKLSLPQSRCA